MVFQQSFSTSTVNGSNSSPAARSYKKKSNILNRGTGSKGSWTRPKERTYLPALKLLSPVEQAQAAKLIGLFEECLDFEDRERSVLYQCLLSGQKLPMADKVTFHTLLRSKNKIPAREILLNSFTTVAEYESLVPANRKQTETPDNESTTVEVGSHPPIGPPGVMSTGLPDGALGACIPAEPFKRPNDAPHNERVLAMFDEYERASIPIGLLEKLSIDRQQHLTSYFEDVSLSRQHHPQLQNPATFALFKETLALVNDRRNVLISLDIEAFEFDTNKITEIGISIYDPSKEAHSIVPQFTTIHILPRENLHLRNGRFVPDHKHEFLCGRSLVLSMKECTKFLESLFHHYTVTRKQAGMGSVIVGHDVRGDLRWLRSMNVNIPDDVPVADTQMLYKCTTGQQASLTKLLTVFKIPHSCMHNGANDAYFTLLLLFHLADPTFRKTFGLDSPEHYANFLAKTETLKSSVFKPTRQPKGANGKVLYNPVACLTHLDALQHAYQTI